MCAIHNEPRKSTQWAIQKYTMSHAKVHNRPCERTQWAMQKYTVGPIRIYSLCLLTAEVLKRGNQGADLWSVGAAIRFVFEDFILKQHFVHFKVTGTGNRTH